MVSDLSFSGAGKVGTRPQTEDFRGTDVSADVLTLTNTSTSSQESVYVNGVRQTTTTDYTASHLTASSTITFTYTPVSTDYITVCYFI